MRRNVILLMSAGAIASLMVLLIVDQHRAQAQRGTGTVVGRVTVRQGGQQPRADRSQIIVYVSTSGPPGNARHGEVRQRELRFAPDLAVIPRGGTVDFPNDDRVFHNVFSLSRTKRFDLGLYQSGESRSVTFNRAGLVDVYCNIHPDMMAQIYVLDTAHFALTTSDGQFLIPDVPVGTWRVSAQPRYGEPVSREVTVAAGASANVTFEVAAGERPSSHTRKDGSPYGRYR